MSASVTVGASAASSTAFIFVLKAANACLCCHQEFASTATRTSMAAIQPQTMTLSTGLRGLAAGFAGCGVGLFSAMAIVPSELSVQEREKSPRLYSAPRLNPQIADSSGMAFFKYEERVIFPRFFRLPVGSDGALVLPQIPNPVTDSAGCDRRAVFRGVYRLPIVR